MKPLLFITTLLVTLFSLETWAYPNFIGYGYSSCLLCHYHPYGNGPLTDYGRALSATTISDRLIHSPSKSEEDVAKKSGFLYREPLNEWLRPSIDYRGLRLGRSLNDQNTTYETIHMQADLNVVIRYKGLNKYITSFSFGYAPPPKSYTGDDNGRYRSREHYIGIKPNRRYGIYVGMMDKVFGIRVPDHIAFSRSSIGLDQDDQTHGVLFHFTKKNLEIGFHHFLGNFWQDSDLRQKGLSTKIEYAFSEKFKPGLSLLASKSDHTKHIIKSIHTKLGLSKGSSLLAEIGLREREILFSSESTESLYGFFQNHFLLRRGLFSILTVEYFKRDLDKSERILRLGPGLQFFPFQGIELRADFYRTKTFTDSFSSKGLWDLAAQIHLWF